MVILYLGEKFSEIMETLTQNYVKISKRIEQAALRSGRRADEILLVAVSKTVGPDAVREAYQLGINDFGENRAQQFILKQSALPEARWHFIGHLQTNKVKEVVGKAFLIHSVDRWRLAEEINKASEAGNLISEVLLQVNISGETQKYGLHPTEVKEFLVEVEQLKSLKIKGLMTMAPLGAETEDARSIFRELRRIQQAMMKLDSIHCDLQYLSMGMSQDFETAIEEGANIIRIGSSLFNT